MNLLIIIFFYMAFQDFGRAAKAAGSFKKPFNKFGGEGEGQEEAPKFGGGMEGGEKPEYKKPEFKKPDMKEEGGEDEDKEEGIISDLVEKMTTLKELADKTDDEEIKSLVGEIHGLIEQLEDNEKNEE